MADWNEVVAGYEKKNEALEAREVAYLKTVALAHKIVIITNIAVLGAGILIGTVI